ncbi:hypothetical protein [Planotetraspora sp. GP83]|uniref:hypothetical protein n=1 Tax=Planotetraspora sp. GP83 TaxID=3156264 RepID=UPI00351224FC
MRKILAADADIPVVVELAMWTTPDMAARLAEHPHAEVRRAVAGNEATPPAVLAALITGEGLPPARRCLVCDRAETPFTHDPHCPRLDCDLPPGASCDSSHESTVHQMHVSALWNPATPTATVIGFADHPSMLLRWPLAVRTDLPPEMYERLATSPEPGVRAALAENPAIGDGLIRVLAADSDAKVVKSIAPHPGLSEARLRAMVDRHGVRVVAKVAKNPDASPALLEDLTRHRPLVPKAFREVARHRNVTAPALLACLSERQARCIAAGHPALPSQVIVELLADDDGQVMEAAAANPALPPAVMAKLVS